MIYEIYRKILDKISDFIEYSYMFLMEVALPLFVLIAMIWCVFGMICTGVDKVRELTQPCVCEKCSYHAEEQIIQEGE